MKRLPGQSYFKDSWLHHQWGLGSSEALCLPVGSSKKEKIFMFKVGKEGVGREGCQWAYFLDASSHDFKAQGNLKTQ